MSEEVTKFYAVVIAKRGGKEILRTAEEFIFGIPEKVNDEQIQLVASAVLVELVGALQDGMRAQAPKKGIRVWPQEG